MIIGQVTNGGNLMVCANGVTVIANDTETVLSTFVQATQYPQKGLVTIDDDVVFACFEGITSASVADDTCVYHVRKTTTANEYQLMARQANAAASSRTVNWAVLCYVPA